MSETDVTKYETLLIARREEIVRKSHQREDLWIIQSHEQIEAVQLAGQREFAARALERKARNLTQIRSALDRIDLGTFGICLDCEEPVSSKRLAAVPWAEYCLHCQEVHDAEQSTVDVEARLAA